jgi:hypothetical protein
MKLTNVLTLALATAVLGSTSFGQATGVNSSQYSSSSPSVRDNPGVLGMTFADFNASWEKIENESDAAYNAAIRGNMPLARGVDGRLSYDYWWYNYSGEKSHYHLVTAESRFYRPQPGAKPFVGLMLGYQWSNDFYNGYSTPPPPAASSALSTSAPVTTSYQGTTTTSTTSTYAGGATATYVTTRTRSNRAVWGASGGVEVPMGSLALTPHVAYFDPMKAHSNWKYSYGLEAHHWFSETLGGYADATYNDARHEANSWFYTAGVRLRY